MGPLLTVAFLLMVLSDSTNSTVTSLQQQPRKTSVSISPSGEVVEGSSVTLTCRSDVNPPVENYIWYKADGREKPGKELKMKTIQNETAQTYEIRNVSTGHSGGYRCLPRPEGSESDITLLNVVYSPRNVSVSISPSGEVVEGSSVTLTCSSDANPPVKIYTWFKGSTQAGTGEKYSITEISYIDRGEYTCKASNKHGTRDSPAVYLNVLYPPKSVSVSISPPGEIVEGSSVNLTCSSDANPPVKNYTWFKEGGTSPVGSGHSYSIINITVKDKGRFYCRAENLIGSQTSLLVSVLEPGRPSNVRYAAAGLTASGGLVLLVLLCKCFRCRRRNGSNKKMFSCNPAGATEVNTPHESDPANQDNILYASVSPRAPLNAQPSVSSSGDHTEYASVKFHHDTDGVKKSGDDLLYASVQFHHPTLSTQLDMETAEDPSVIYSSVKQLK